MNAVWNGTTLAESDATVVEGNHYFPPAGVPRDHLAPSDRHTTCPWKGEASDYDVEADGEAHADAPWYYPDPTAAREIKHHVTFWKGVQVLP